MKYFGWVKTDLVFDIQELILQTDSVFEWFRKGIRHSESPLAFLAKRYFIPFVPGIVFDLSTTKTYKAHKTFCFSFRGTRDGERRNCCSWWTKLKQYFQVSSSRFLLDARLSVSQQNLRRDAFPAFSNLRGRTSRMKRNRREEPEKEGRPARTMMNVTNFGICWREVRRKSFAAVTPVTRYFLPLFFPPRNYRGK